ncbi:MAG: hypothetical protein QXL18_01690 [Candidatus Woesearchaeota archaeon]
MRNKIKLPFLTCIRLGSTTVGNLNYAVEINKPEAIKNSSNKLKMKNCFQNYNVFTADWSDSSNLNNWLNKDKFPIVAKHIYGSRGKGNTLIKTLEEFENWKINKNLSNYIFEKFYTYSREYRLHVTEDGCFYTCRKVLKNDTPEEDRWHRHDSNSNWILESNPLFDKPINWNEIEENCVKALKSVGLDIGACDVKVQSAKNKKGKLRERCDFIVLEINSAPSFGEITLQKYIEQIPKLAQKLYERK